MNWYLTATKVFCLGNKVFAYSFSPSFPRGCVKTKETEVLETSHPLKRI
jgi:hypothetical protein